MSRIDELLKRRKHLDPLKLAESESPATAEERFNRLASPGMQSLRQALLTDGASDVRESVLGDLRTYFTDEYFASGGPDEAARRDQVAMWSINLLWYAYLQAEGFAYPVQVEVGHIAGKASNSARHLDFGSGVGITSQLFASLGYAVELADVESDLLAFARHRLLRRGVIAQYVDLGTEHLNADAFDVVTAIDTLSFVPDFRASVREIRSAMRMGGLLFANFDTRHGVQIGWDILHHDDLRLRRQLQGTGFEPDQKLGAGVRLFMAVETGGLPYFRRRLRDELMFPSRRIYRTARTGISALGAKVRER